MIEMENGGRHPPHSAKGHGNRNKQSLSSVTGIDKKANQVCVGTLYPSLVFMMLL